MDVVTPHDIGSLSCENVSHAVMIISPASFDSKESRALILHKVLAMMALVLTSMGCSTLPFVLLKLGTKWNCPFISNKLISGLNCVTAGFYLGMTFLYFLVHARNYLDRYIEQGNIYVTYPLLESLVCLGFIMISTIDAIVHFGAYVFVMDIASVSSGLTDLEARHIQRVNVYSPTLQKIVVILGISLQTLFAGLAIGLQHFMSEVFQLMVAIMLYTGIVSFDLGQKLYTVYYNKALVAFNCCILFAVVCPVGISMGIAISEVEIHQKVYPLTLLSGIFLALATGMFLHVSFINYIHVKAPHQEHYNGFVRLILMTVGLLLVSCLKVVNTAAMEDFVERITA